MATDAPPRHLLRHAACWDRSDLSPGPPKPVALGVRMALAAGLPVAVVAAGFRAAGDQAKCTPVCGRARSAVAERATAAGMAERGYARSCERVESGWTDRRRRPWLRGADAARKARSATARTGRRSVCRTRPSEPRAGTVTPLSARTLTGGDVGTGRNVRPSFRQQLRSIFIRDFSLDERWGVPPEAGDRPGGSCASGFDARPRSAPRPPAPTSSVAGNG